MAVDVAVNIVKSLKKIYKPTELQTGIEVKLDQFLGVGGEGAVMMINYKLIDRALKISNLKSDASDEISNTGNIGHKNIIQLIAWSILNNIGTNDYFNGYGKFIQDGQI